MLLVLFLALLGTMWVFVAWIVIGIWVLRGPEEAIEGLLLSLLLTFINPELVPVREIASFARWFILLEASVRIAFEWFRHPVPLPSWSKFLFAFVVYATLTSLSVSAWPLASLIKLASFAILLITAYLGVRMGKKDFGITLIAFGTVVALLSLPLHFSTIGYIRNGTQFQGILSHPQSYGVIVSIPLALAVGRWLLDPSFGIRWYQIIFLGVMTVTAVMSGSRTGYFALILGFGIGILMHKSRSRHLNQLLFSPITYFGLAAVVVLLWVTSPTTQIQQFVYERDVLAYKPYELSIDPESSAVSHLFASRWALAERSWSTYTRHPLFGIGFGISTNPESVALATIVAGVPVSLPAEKGFMVTAALEEVGLLGSILLFLMILSQFRVVRKSVKVSVISLFLTALFVNLGESLYFASGGIGVLVHVAVAIALVSVERQKLAEIPTSDKPVAAGVPETAPISFPHRVTD
ncbi:MAG: hypothetical protein GY759_24055 [Chloroflexi bacterium]|nr:hypothetical protein [Chloroflexota bacterium]